MFDLSRTNLDDFYFRQLRINISPHKKFVFVLKFILTHSHDHAAVEKGFSLGKSLLQCNTKEESIVAKMLVRDHLQANNIKIETFEVPNKLIISCNTAHSRYKASLREKTKEAKKVVENERSELFQSENKRIYIAHVIPWKMSSLDMLQK